MVKNCHFIFLRWRPFPVISPFPIPSLKILQGQNRWKIYAEFRKNRKFSKGRKRRSKRNIKKLFENCWKAAEIWLDRIFRILSLWRCLTLLPILFPIYHVTKFCHFRRNFFQFFCDDLTILFRVLKTAYFQKVKKIYFEFLFLGKCVISRVNTLIIITFLISKLYRCLFLKILDIKFYIIRWNFPISKLKILK